MEGRIVRLKEDKNPFASPCCGLVVYHDTDTWTEAGRPVTQAELDCPDLPRGVCQVDWFGKDARDLFDQGYVWAADLEVIQ